jgi:osmotically-inducible protein OsmY
MKRSIWMVAMVVALFAVFAVAQTPADSSQSPSTATPSQSTPDASATSQQPGMGQSTGQASGSSDVQAKIQSALQQDQSLASSSVSAEVTDSKVTLSGTVASQADKDKAESIAQANAGSRQVENKIKVSSSSSK